MGTLNVELIRRCERARRTGDKAALERWARAVDATQAACDHPKPHRTHQIVKDSPTGKYRRGDILTWCAACSKVLSGGTSDMIGVMEMP
jgi:hypothetical protein